MSITNPDPGAIKVKPVELLDSSYLLANTTFRSARGSTSFSACTGASGNPSDWSKSDWNDFYNYIFSCAQLYLREGLVRTSLDSYKRKQIKSLIEGQKDFGFVEWLEDWIRSDRLENNCHLNDGVTFEALYTRARTDLEDMKWTVADFKVGVWKYCKQMGYGFNEQLAHKGNNMSSRRNRKGSRDNQLEWICITTPTDKTQVS